MTRFSSLCAAMALAAGPVFAQSDLSISVTALAEPIQYVDIRSAVNGRVDKLQAREGEIVSQEAQLGAIDASVQTARVAFARVAAEGKGSLLRAQTALAQAEALLVRVRAAKAKGAAQLWEVEQTEQGVALAEADVLIASELAAQSLAQLRLEVATLDEFSFRAPFDGTVLEVFVEVGETIDTQTVIMSLGKLDRLKATAFVPVDWVETLRVGDVMRARLGTTPSRDVEMTVSVIDPRVDPVSQTVRTVLEIDNSDRSILVGTSLEIGAP